MLEFLVDGQLLRRMDAERVVSDSAEFLKFRASFSKEWEGYTKTFLFRGKDGESYCVFAVEADREYSVPHEVLVADTVVEVSVFGSSKLCNFATVNSVLLYVEKSGLLADFKQSVVPSPDLYAQICHKLEETLRLLPGKNLELKTEKEKVYWKRGEDTEWKLLFSLAWIRGQDGALWHSGTGEPSHSLGKSGDFFFWEEKGIIWEKKNNAWKKVFDPESYLLGLTQRAEAAQIRAQEHADQSQESARLVRELLEPPALYPDAFQVWNADGSLSDLAVGQALQGCIMEPERTYRVSVVGGKTYRFTPTPSAQGNRYYFAVGDGEGICLFFTEESLSEYTVEPSYGGRIPTHIYYGVKNAKEEGLFFQEAGFSGLLRRLTAAEEACEALAARVSALEGGER